MTKHANIPEPDDELSSWIRQHPDVWADAVDAPSSSEIDDLVGQVVSGARDLRRAEETGRRRRRFVATGVLTIIVVTGGPVGVAALIRSGQPSRPSEGKVVVQPLVDRVDLRFKVGASTQVCFRLRLLLSEAFELADRDAEFVVGGLHTAW